MANPYTKPSISGYNSNPPPDDGSQTADNEISWSKHETKLSGPVKDYADSINNATESAFAERLLNSVSAVSSDYTVQASDRGKLLSVTNTVTITLLPAGTAGSGFELVIRNDGSGTVTVDGDGSETINGSTTIDLSKDDWVALVSDGSNWSGLHYAFGGITASEDDLNATAGHASELNTILDNYAEQTVELGGDFDADQFINCVRIGNIVTITRAGSLQHTSSSSPTSDSNVIPETFRPSHSQGVVYLASTTGPIRSAGVFSSDWSLSLLYVDYTGSAQSDVSSGRGFSITYAV